MREDQTRNGNQTLNAHSDTTRELLNDSLLALWIRLGRLISAGSLMMFPATSTVAESTLPNLALPACLGRKGRKSKLHEDRGAPFRYLTWRSSTTAADGRGRERRRRAHVHLAVACAEIRSGCVGRRRRSAYR